VVTAPFDSVDVTVVAVAAELLDDAGGFGSALGVAAASVVCDELESATGVEVSDVVDGEAAVVSVTGALDEAEVELLPGAVVVPASVELLPDALVVACPVVDVCVSDWPAGPTVPELAAGGGGDWPDGRTT